MSRQWPLNSDYDYWLHQQLEPTDIIRTGNYKRHQETSMTAKNKAIDKMREEMGQEEMTRREIEFKQSQKADGAFEEIQDEYLKSKGI